MLTIYLLTRNNAPTIQKTLESILSLEGRILVGDLGSTDETVSLCENHAEVFRLGDMRRDAARNHLLEYESDLNFFIEPWEILAMGNASVEAPCYTKIMNSNKLITKEIRFWKPGVRFINHTYERLNVETNRESNVVLYSTGQRDYDYDLPLLEQWKADKPTDAAPYYYHACILLAQGKIREFFHMAEHYLFIDSKSMSATMLRYYMAMAYLVHERKSTPALQNLNLCLSAQPLMAEFWCLMADVYYHILNRFDSALEFYENAIIMGSRRLKNDKWPMDIAKYREYPQKMMKSCVEILNRHSFYYDRA
jgi:tetratricopeptide (TPR) repeat protein